MNGAGEDLDLSNDLYVLYARRTTASTTLTTLQSHSSVDSALRSVAIRAPSTVRYTVTTASTSIIAPVRAPEDYRLQILNPTGCSRADCNLFIGIDTNTGDNGFLDIYMEGTAEGWVAVGFSETANMVSKYRQQLLLVFVYLCTTQLSADVVSCNRQGDTIVAIDGWNRASGRASDTDTILDVTLFSASFNATTNRLYCT